jgi:PEP-CTERM motif-containing protein
MVIKRLGGLLLLAGALAIGSTSAHALVINATFVNGPNGEVFDAASQAVVMNAIGFYESTFSDNVTVNIQFHDEPNCYGCSNTTRYAFPYSTFQAALVADTTSADDAIATANLPSSLLFGTDVNVKPAEGRAIGLNTPKFSFNDGFCLFTGDGCIGLNLATIAPFKELLTVVEHEIDEILGLGSGLFPGGKDNYEPEDLFRYGGIGALSYSNNPAITDADGNCITPPTPRAYFSIDGGNTNLHDFNNCDNGGDYGDWAWEAAHQVNDWRGRSVGFGGPTLDAASIEVRALDVLGWDLTSATAPEPATALLVGLGALGLGWSRRNRG